MQLRLSIMARDCAFPHLNGNVRQDVRDGDRFIPIRRQVFGGNFPGSALITITALAVPEAKIEIQGYAVIGGR